MSSATPPPSVFDGIAGVIAVLVLLAEFGMLHAALLFLQLRLYAAQSFLLSVLAGVAAYAKHVPELYALAVLSCALKVFAVPATTRRLVGQPSQEIAGSGVLGVGTRTLLGLAVTAVGFFAAKAWHIHGTFLPSTALSLSVSVLLVSFVLMIVRRDVVSQAVGLFSLENAVSLASLVVAAAMPLLLEVAFLFDLLVAVVVFGVLIRTHQLRRRSFLTTDLTELRG